MECYITQASQCLVHYPQQLQLWMSMHMCLNVNKLHLVIKSWSLQLAISYATSHHSLPAITTPPLQKWAHPWAQFLCNRNLSTNTSLFQCWSQPYCSTRIQNTTEAKRAQFKRVQRKQCTMVLHLKASINPNNIRSTTTALNTIRLNTKDLPMLCESIY